LYKLKYNFDLFLGESGWTASSQIKGIEGREAARIKIGFTLEGLHPSGNQGDIGGGIKITIGAFPLTKGDMDIEAAVDIVTHDGFCNYANFSSSYENIRIIYSNFL
jgi:hypothetical protein